MAPYKIFAKIEALRLILRHSGGNSKVSSTYTEHSRVMLKFGCGRWGGGGISLYGPLIAMADEVKNAYIFLLMLMSWP